MGCSGSKCVSKKSPASLAVRLPAQNVAAELQRKGAGLPELTLLGGLGKEELLRAFATRTPPPEGLDTWSTWKDNGGEELEPLFQHTTLVDARWLLRFARREVLPELQGVFPVWQQLPAAAVVPLSELQRSTMQYGLPIGVVSCGWASRTHPDPAGAQLRSLIPVLEAVVEECRGGSWGVETWGVLWDYMSFPQAGAAEHALTPDQRTRRREGVGSIHTWYGAHYTHTLVLDVPLPKDAPNPRRIEERGWSIFERRLSSLVKDDFCYLELHGMGSSRDGGWEAVRDACSAVRDAPLAPDVFETEMRLGVERDLVKEGTGVWFADPEDLAEVVLPQYHSAFLSQMAKATSLMYAGRGWSDPQTEQLAAALSYAHAHGSTAKLEALSLRENRIGDAGIKALSAVLVTGALPKIENLRLSANQIGDEGAVALSTAVESGALRHLTHLYLDHNKIGDVGMVTLLGSLSKGSVASLSVLDVSSNQLGDASVSALVTVIGSLSSLSLVYLQCNLGDATPVQSACEMRGIRCYA
mmetsp:Transcript_47060/g.106113  ORF Transcript_47060/g.106113 Transcript_47060/m.106113 type:complete len:527 (-) Transcript_47060:160-1740(-)